MILSVGLAMDAFAVAVCKGLSMDGPRLGSAAIVGAWFGVFQGLMPLLGYSLGVQFAEYTAAVDHWIAFALLAAVGVNMIRSAVDPAEPDAGGGTGPRTMFMAAVATSIDALAVGVTFAFFAEDTHCVGIIPAVIIIGIITFVLSACGVKVGSVFGAKYKARAELAGGVVVILIGLKILLEDLFSKA